MNRQWRAEGLRMGIAIVFGVLVNLPLWAHAEAGKAAQSLTWRPLVGTCLPRPGPLYEHKALRSLTANTPVDLTAEADFVSRFGCASGLDWSRERLIVLMLETRHVSAVDLRRVSDANSRLQLRFSVQCGPGNPISAKDSPLVNGAFLFFAVVVPKTASTLELKYEGRGRYANYRTLLESCSKIPAAHPVGR